MGRDVELVSCETCGGSFERKFGRAWQTLCVGCYVETKIVGKAARNRAIGPEVIPGKVITGPLYEPSGCDCGAPPWEVCKHSFPEYQWWINA
jgi:hypothetical protein